MKKGILLNAAVLLCMTGFVYAQESQYSDELSGTIDVTYTSAYMWRGFDMYAGAHGEGAIQPSIDLDLYGTGFGINVFWSRANTAKVKAVSLENSEELDTTLYYCNKLFEYETYATNYTLGWVYYDYPDEPSNVKNAQEMFLTLSWPEICAEGVVPSYTLIRMWADDSDAMASDLSGWAHVFGLGYDLPVEGILPDVPEQILHLSFAAVYNEGMGAAGVDHDWSHAVFGVSTDFDLGNNLTFVPAVYYQSTWEESLSATHDIEDVFWASLSVRYSF